MTDWRVKTVPKSTAFCLQHYIFVGDCQIPLAIKMFIEEHGEELMSKGLYKNYLLHISNLFEFGVLPPGLNVFSFVLIWIPCEYLNTEFTWIPYSSEYRTQYRTVWVSGYQTFWTLNRLFSVWFSDHHSNNGPFDNRTEINCCMLL